jgi:hypothetical protein
VSTAAGFLLITVSNVRAGASGVLRPPSQCLIASRLKPNVSENLACVIPSRLRIALTPILGDFADLERGECKGGTITATSYHTEDYPGALLPSGFIRPAGSPQESCQNGSSRRIRREVEGEACQGNCLRRGISAALGVRGCPKSTLPKSAKCFKILVSAAGFEPATHALKGHCSTT